MEMKLKLKKGVQPTQEQAKEIANVIMEQPDMTWEGEFKNSEPISERHKAYMVELDGEYGTYIYKVNLSWEMITVLEIK